eukprot:TRINITY_DN10562_c0_g1_i2.p1 TRINITY_DN10562_c0_g1~~TRINITY_DN10562_c0_g1_i2.p1  ORF type:complete len:232 (+),score=36.20 TRINITY_DN10562_c0_g1_i2:81-776(+)
MSGSRERFRCRCLRPAFAAMAALVSTAPWPLLHSRMHRAFLASLVQRVPFSAAASGLATRHRAMSLYVALPTLSLGRAAASATSAQSGQSQCSTGPTTDAEDQLQARQLREEARSSDASSAGSSAALAELPAVVIDAGAFKYVLLQVTAATGEQRYLVRGTAGAPYHRDVATPYVRAYVKQGFGVEILGGGRIFHDPERRDSDVRTERTVIGSGEDLRIFLWLSMGGWCRS